MHDLTLSHAISSTSPSSEDLLILEKLKIENNTTSTSTSTSTSCKPSNVDLILVKEEETTCFVCMCELPKESFSFCQQLCDIQEHQSYCNDCFANYLQVKLKDGEFNFSFCLGSKCKGRSIPSEEKLRVIKGLVKEKEYQDKFEKNLLERCLLQMRDMVWCPNKACSAPVFVSLSNKDAYCSACETQFCWKCTREHHYGICPPESKDPEPMDALSYEWIKSKTKPCPRCNIQIEKNGGCDHMFCSRCQFHFNWSQSECGTVKVPFQVTKVKNVFNVLQDRVSEEVFIVVGPRFKTKTTIFSQSCSVCKSKVEKDHYRFNNSNHIMCSNCKTKICFLCGEVAKTTAHFHQANEVTKGTPSTKCLQHTSTREDLTLYKNFTLDPCGLLKPAATQKTPKVQKQKDELLFEGEDEDFEFHEYFC